MERLLLIKVDCGDKMCDACHLRVEQEPWVKCAPFGDQDRDDERSADCFASDVTHLREQIEALRREDKRCLEC